MTEITVECKTNEEIQRGPFALALILAPLTTGVPAVIIIALASLVPEQLYGIIIVAMFPAVATVLGAPTYLLFGGIAFDRALKNETSMPLAGFMANLVSLPFVIVIAGLINGLEGVIFALVFYGGLGSICALIWGAIFESLYKRFTL